MDEFKKPILPVKTETKIIPTETDPITVPKEPKPKSSCPYKIPDWSDTPNSNKEYKFEILKSGQILDEIKYLHKQAVWTFGRLPENDIEMAHPTISRFHAVLQYRPQKKVVEDNESDDNSNTNEAPEGWYIYDLGSTHGTFLNKQRIPPRVYIRIRVGHMLKLGGSTRSYILQGPAEDEEPESELSITELREKRQREIEEAAIEEKRKIEEEEERKRNEGVSWGMSEDADEETDLAHNPYASTNNEELFLDDPKKTLRGYFEREGLQLEYKCDEMSSGSFVCRVELPVDDANGRPIIAEVVHKGRKKDCVVQCALEACRILDRHGVLRQANQEPLKRKIKSNSDSDEDEFWDRTGDIERKKQKKQNIDFNHVLTYDELLEKAKELQQQLDNVEKNIENYHIVQKRLKDNKTQNTEDLDSFMENLDDGTTQIDKTEIRKLRVEQQRIKVEQQKMERLIKIAKPTDFSSLKPAGTEEGKSHAPPSKKLLPMIGKRNQFSKFRILKPIVKQELSKTLPSDEEEFDEIKDNQDQLKTEMEQPEDTAITINKATTKADKISVDNISEEPQAEECNEKSPNKDCKEKSTSEESKDAKKKRNRQRLRPTQRQLVDSTELDEHESSDKYAKWVPPEDQTGDGITALNEKFGY